MHYKFVTHRKVTKKNIIQQSPIKELIANITSASNFEF